MLYTVKTRVRPLPPLQFLTCYFLDAKVNHPALAYRNREAFTTRREDGHNPLLNDHSDLAVTLAWRTRVESSRL